MIHAGNILLFVDEIHTIIGAGGAEGALDASNILKPSLARGEIQLIGATTIEEYRKHIEKDAALERRFQPVTVEEPDREEAIEILKGLRSHYEEHHQVEITDSGVEAAVDLSMRYINDRFLPDKAIDLMDEASSKVRLGGYKVPGQIEELEQKMKQCDRDLEQLLMEGNIEEASLISGEKQEMEETYEKLLKKYKRCQKEEIGGGAGGNGGYCLRLDKNTRKETGGRRGSQTAAAGKNPPQTCGGTGGSSLCCGKSRAPGACRFKRPQTSHWFFSLFGTYRRGKNRDYQGPGRRYVWGRTGYDSGGYV